MKDFFCQFIVNIFFSVRQHNPYVLSHIIPIKIYEELKNFFGHGGTLDDRKYFYLAEIYIFF